MKAKQICNWLHNLFVCVLNSIYFEYIFCPLIIHELYSDQKLSFTKHQMCAVWARCILNVANFSWTAHLRMKHNMYIIFFCLSSFASCMTHNIDTAICLSYHWIWLVLFYYSGYQIMIKYKWNITVFTDFLEGLILLKALNTNKSPVS